MTTNMRFGKKWTINEILSLQREYELLEWSVQQIASKHRRSVRAILFKLEAEGFISSWDEARGFDLESYKTEMSCEPECDTECVLDYDVNDEEDDDVLTIIDDHETDKAVYGLTERVWNLETSVNEISVMVKKMFEVLVSKQKAKRAPLRSY
jgi:hypothetical protein